MLKKNSIFFLDVADELTNRRFTPDGLTDFNFKIYTDNQSGKITTEIHSGDEEDFRSFLMTFRKFILNEPANVDHILNKSIQLIKKDKFPDLWSKLKTMKSFWRQIYSTGIIKIRNKYIDNISPEYVLSLFCSYYFHHDNKGRIKELKRLLDSEPRSAEIQLYWSLPKLVDIILGTSALIRQGLDKDAFDFS